jgi:putative transposase
MKRRRYTPEQIVRKLREADRLLGEGQELPEVVKFLEVSERRITAGGRSTAG